MGQRSTVKMVIDDIIQDVISTLNEVDPQNRAELGSTTALVHGKRVTLQCGDAITGWGTFVRALNSKPYRYENLVSKTINDRSCRQHVVQITLFPLDEDSNPGNGTSGKTPSLPSESRLFFRGKSSSASRPYTNSNTFVQDGNAKTGRISCSLIRNTISVTAALLSIAFLVYNFFVTPEYIGVKPPTDATPHP